MKNKKSKDLGQGTKVLYGDERFEATVENNEAIGEIVAAKRETYRRQPRTASGE